MERIRCVTFLAEFLGTREADFCLRPFAASWQESFHGSLIIGAVAVYCCSMLIGVEKETFLHLFFIYGGRKNKTLQTLDKDRPAPH